MNRNVLYDILFEPYTWTGNVFETDNHIMLIRMSGMSNR